MAGAHHSKKAHSKRDMTSLQKRAFLTFSLFVLMAYGLTQVSVTSPISAETSTSVLGEEDEHKEEQKKEEHREDRPKQEDKKRDIPEKRPEDNRPQGKPLEPKMRPNIEIEQKKRIENERVQPQNGLFPRKKVENELEQPDELEQTEQQKELIKRNVTDFRTTDGQRIRTKVEDDGTKKIEIKGQDYKLKYEIRDGKLKVEAKSEDGEDVDIPDEAASELEDSLNSELKEEGIEVDSSTENPSIVKNGFRARTAFPLTINPLTKTLTVTTPAGEREVAVLPDEAIDNLKATGVVDQLDGTDASSPEGSSEIVEHKDKMAYKIKGTRRHRVFGFIPVNLPVTAYVSAETGQPLEKEQSLFTNIIDSISL